MEHCLDLIFVSVDIYCRALVSMPLLMFMPLFQFVMVVILFVYWVVVAVYLASAGSFNNVRSNIPITPFHTRWQFALSHPFAFYRYCYLSLLPVYILPIPPPPKFAHCLPQDTKTFQIDQDLRRAMIYHFFGLLWTRSFIVAWGSITFAGAVYEWYFSADKNVGHFSFTIVESYILWTQHVIQFGMYPFSHTETLHLPACLQPSSICSGQPLA